MSQADFYQEYWQEGKHYNPEWDAKRFQKMMGVLVGRDSVLDYGCGPGYAYQRRLLLAVNDYIGADVSNLAIGDAKKKGLRALSISPDTGAVDLPNASVGSAVCIEVLEHLFDPLQSAREMHRVIKPGGVIVITVPNFGYHAWRLMALLRAQVPSEPENVKINRYNGVHIRFFSKLMLKRLLQDAGFVDIKIGSFDDGSVWDVFKAGGYFGYISRYAHDHFPSFMHLHFMEDLWPNVFAMRLHAVARKPESKASDRPGP
jgi:SAM-dependent methyltransferase